MRYSLSSKAQNVIEHIVVVLAVVLVVLAFTVHNGAFHRAVDKMLTQPDKMLQQNF